MKIPESPRIERRTSMNKLTHRAIVYLAALGLAQGAVAGADNFTNIAYRGRP